MPNKTSMMPAINSSDNAILSGIDILSSKITKLTANKEIVWPNPQNMPNKEELLIDLFLEIIADTAAIWSASNACFTPNRKPNASKLNGAAYIIT